MQPIYENIERFTEYNIPERYWENRKPGLSALLRLANEEEWIRPCIESIIDWHDEIICCLQCSEDRTEEILQSFDSDKISIYKYPFKSVPNGPEHEYQPQGSVYERAYFYNWCLSKTQYDWIDKWDGDMVAHDWLGSVVKELIGTGDYDLIGFNGINIVHDLVHTSKSKLLTDTELRVFKMVPGACFWTKHYCEKLYYPDQVKDRIFKTEKPGYLHFKHAKKDSAVLAAWPDNWKDIPHFQKIYMRYKPGEVYEGEIPEPLKGII